jgi:hypothetical protein
MSDPKISAFVICYNRAEILATCLRALAFADELIVVDKSSTDESLAIASALATRVVSVPWTPTVEETRTLALSLCRHPWVLFMDDDECLSPGSGGWIRTELRKPSADIYTFPLRHYILGVHDERAYYWPESHVRMFRRGAVTFSRTVHAGIVRHSDKVRQLPLDGDAYIHHLSHPDVAGWIEKTNRYTSRSDRAGCATPPDGLAEFARQRIEYWTSRSDDDDPNGYPAAVALLRAIYDMVDVLKDWEAKRALNGAALFHQACADLDAAIGHTTSVLAPSSDGMAAALAGNGS